MITSISPYVQDIIFNYIHQYYKNKHKALQQNLLKEFKFTNECVVYYNCKSCNRYTYAVYNWRRYPEVDLSITLYKNCGMCAYISLPKNYWFTYPDGINDILKIFS